MLHILAAGFLRTAENKAHALFRFAEYLSYRIHGIDAHKRRALIIGGAATVENAALLRHRIRLTRPAVPLGNDIKVREQHEVGILAEIGIARIVAVVIHLKSVRSENALGNIKHLGATFTERETVFGLTSHTFFINKKFEFLRIFFKLFFQYGRYLFIHKNTSFTNRIVSHFSLFVYKKSFRKISRAAVFAAAFPFSEELTDFAPCSVKNRTPASVLSGNERRAFMFILLLCREYRLRCEYSSLRDPKW